MRFFKRLIDILTIGSNRPLRHLLTYYLIVAAVVVVVFHLVPSAGNVIKGDHLKTLTTNSQLLQDGPSTTKDKAAEVPPETVADLALTTIVALHPYLGLRGGAKKAFGGFLFQDSLFIAGRADVRTLDLRGCAGDACLSATAELRSPVAQFTVLLSLNVGLLAGLWVAVHELSPHIRVIPANQVGQPAVIALRFAPLGVSE